MRIYRRVIRALFAVIFIAGGIVHFVLGRISPEGYEAFGATALFPWLTNLWDSFVMPNIGWLTIGVGIFEILCGIGLTRRHLLRTSTVVIIGFLIFVTVLGYGFPTETVVEDLLKNRIITIVMALLLVPLLVHPGPCPTPVTKEAR